MGLFNRKPKAPALVDLYAVSGQEDCRYNIVGESRCSDHLMSIIRRSSPEDREAGEVTLVAYFVPEPNNEFDPQAIGVWMGDGRVGYISRSETAEFHELIDRAAQAGGRVVVVARIGWDTENPSPLIGVRLALPELDEFENIRLLTLEQVKEELLRSGD
jgi:hypothetical protein